MTAERKYTNTMQSGNDRTYVDMSEWATKNHVEKRDIGSIRRAYRNGVVDDETVVKIWGRYGIDVDTAPEHIVNKYGAGSGSKTRRVDDPDAKRFVLYASWDSIRTALTTLNVRIWSSRLDGWVMLSTSGRIDIRDDDNALLGWVDDDDERHVVETNDDDDDEPNDDDDEPNDDDDEPNDDVL